MVIRASRRERPGSGLTSTGSERARQLRAPRARTCVRDTQFQFVAARVADSLRAREEHREEKPLAHRMRELLLAGNCVSIPGSDVLRARRFAVSSRDVVRVLIALAAALIAITMAPAAQAIPAFARRTGMACTACHDAWPRLNDFGELYRDNGYQLPGRQDTDPPVTGDYFPISVRPALLYQYTLTTNQPSDVGPITVGSGSVGFPSGDLLAGGSLASNIAALVVVSGFGADGLASIESAWARLSNIAHSTWINVRAGKIELDLPASEHRAFTLTQPYAIYHYLPQGSSNTWQLGENQLGVELMGHPNGVGFRYALAVVSANDNPGTDAFWSAPTGYLHLTETFYPFATFLTRIRLGAFGVLGFNGTRPINTTMGGMPMPIAGTFTDHKPFMQAGGELGFTLGPLTHPFQVHVMGLYGQQDQAFVSGGTQSASYAGGFVELAYTPILRTTVFGRYDFVHHLQNSDQTLMPASTGDINGGSLGWRFALLQSWTAAANIHAEASWLVTQGVGANGLNQQQFIMAVGFDVAL